MAGSPKQMGQDANPPDISLDKIQTFLRAKDDTQRFVGLALLRSVLDNSAQVRDSPGILTELWTSISPKFQDRLLRTGSNSLKKDAKEMLSLSVAVIHTFTILLPDEEKSKPRLTERIPPLVQALLYSSAEVTPLVLQILQTLVSFKAGAKVLIEVQDLSPLTEIAPNQSTALDVLLLAILNSMSEIEDLAGYKVKVEDTLQRLVSSFTGTDAVTLLRFVDNLLRQVSPAIIDEDSKWPAPCVSFIKQLSASRPTTEARAAYTTAAASLLQTFPQRCPGLLFRDDQNSDSVFLFVSLLLVDIRSSLPTLLQRLNHPEYPQLSQRLGSAYDIISMLIAELIRSLDNDSNDMPVLSPDHLLKLRKSIPETMSVTVEYLRDRWDSSVAGAMGLHPDAIPGAAETSMGKRHTVAWDSAVLEAEGDPMVLSAVRALALWVREDDNDLLRKEATGLTDMFLSLYESAPSAKLDFRSPVLVAFEGLLSLNKGRRIFLDQAGWSILSKDLVNIMQSPDWSSAGGECMRGADIVRVLSNIVEQEEGSTSDEWMDLITNVAAWNIPEQLSSTASTDFTVAVLQLASSLLARAGEGTRKRYKHSIVAIRGIAHTVSAKVKDDGNLQEAVQEVLDITNAVG